VRRRGPAFLVLLLSFSLPSRLFAQCPDGSPPPCRQPTRAAAPTPNSVAVLFFDNLSPDTADAYLADGLTDEIIARLGQIERLQVKSRTAVARYRRATLAPGELGRTLGVAFLVNGTIRRGARRLRVTVELVHAASGNRQWGQQYDRTDADLLAIEEDIARAVVTAVAGRLAPSERASLAARPTHSAVAYDHYLRGNYALAQRSQAGFARALAEYQSALRLDSTFASALSRIAYTYASSLALEWAVPGLPAESLLDRGVAIADRAVRLDSMSSDAWMARGFLLQFRNPTTFRGVREALERAIALDPENADAQHTYGTALLWLGNDSAGEAAFQRALAIDPARRNTLRFLALLRLLQHAYAPALRWADSAIAVDPTFLQAYVDRARARRLLGDTAGARRDADVVQQFATAGMRRWAEVTRVLADAAAGNMAEARARADRLYRETGAGDSTGPRLGFRESAYLAIAQVVVGEPDRALSTLENARRWGLLLRGLLRSPEFNVIRDQPRFQRLVEELQP
jgi:TolB-like protein